MGEVEGLQHTLVKIWAGLASFVPCPDFPKNKMGNKHLIMFKRADLKQPATIGRLCRC